MPGEFVDLASEPAATAVRTPSQKRYLGIHFYCCDVYHRILLNRDGTAYQGHCPRCARPVRVAVGPGGTDQRFFRVS